MKNNNNAFVASISSSNPFCISKGAFTVTEHAFFVASFHVFRTLIIHLFGFGSMVRFFFFFLVLKILTIIKKQNVNLTTTTCNLGGD